MATYLTLEPAPATTAWLPWLRHPLWVGQDSPPLALRDCTLFHGHVLLVAKGHRHAGFDGFLNCQTSSWVPSLGSWIAEFSGPLPRDVSEERVQAVGV